MPTRVIDPPAGRPAHPAPAQRAPRPPARPHRDRSDQLDRARGPNEPLSVLDAVRPDNLSWKSVDWVVLGWMGSMHVGALAAPFFFSWSALGVAVLLHWVTASIGICMGYHRYLAHRSLKLAKPAEFVAMLCGTVSGEGTPLMWAATHRLHHQRSDQEGDPHSPLDGKWWSHLLWLFVRVPKAQQQALYRRYVPELVDRPLMRFFERTAGWWLLVTAAGLLLLGGAIGGLTGALSMLLWGLCVRMVVAYHSTWFVNSATHLWGYRNYETRDESRNLWWVALMAYGEGWHNNHHAHPRVARAGHRWWEIDMTWWLIKGLRLCRLASDVHDQLPERSPPSVETRPSVASVKPAVEN